MINIDENKLKVVAELLKRERNPENFKGVYHTDEEVLTAEEVFFNLTKLGKVLGLETLSDWAYNRYNTYRSLAIHRELPPLNLNQKERTRLTPPSR